MEDLQPTMLGIFTEAAILEHLIRERGSRLAMDGLQIGEFGILNYFVLNRPTPDSIAGIAWSFQEDEAHTRAKVEKLAASGLVTLTADATDDDAVVMITDKGRDAHSQNVARMAPEIRQAVSEIPADALKLTFQTLREIRLTLDNLPDR